VLPGSEKPSPATPAQNHGHFGIFHGHFPIIDFFTLFHTNVKIKNALCKDFIYAISPLESDALQTLSKKAFKIGHIWWKWSLGCPKKQKFLGAQFFPIL
jgi:hypothetical protein